MVNHPKVRNTFPLFISKKHFPSAQIVKTEACIFVTEISLLQDLNQDTLWRPNVRVNLIFHSQNDLYKAICI